MNAWIHQTREILRLEHIHMYAVACLDIFIILGTLIGRDTFFNSASISIALAVTIALLLVIVSERFSYRIETWKESFDLLVAAFGEGVLLFGIPLLVPTQGVFFLLQIVAIAIVQSCAAFFFWKACAKPLAALLTFVNMTLLVLSTNLSAKLTKLTHITSKTTRTKHI